NEDAFRNCSSLTQIDMPEGLTSIGTEAFSGCSSLKEITITKLIRRIEGSTFIACTNLETVVFEGPVQDISSNAFYRCRNLKTFTISQDFWVFASEDAFAECYVDKCELRVPYGRKAKYEQHEFWKTFGSIVEIVEARENVCEAVDLGLSVKWATCNVGAYSPEEPGRYFAWGETEDKFEYYWSNYKYCNGSKTTLTKYNTDSNYGIVDNKTTLDLSDDAARANWGGAWRMPTYNEWDELKNSCTWTWTTQNGVNGYKVTSKTNGNSIFLPAAGYRDGTSVYSVGSRGCYWSSSLHESYPYYAYYLRFNSGTVGWSYNNRYYGHTVRAVCL
ncbi:MAG: leucine-rich repeat protein, partial [Bacteroidales bacterium]|nr:leucine-rich repeat protein [Bacteroidales bacterium]